MAAAVTIHQITRSAGSVTVWDPQAFGNSGVVKTVPATLISLVAVNKGAPVLWLMLFDATSVPANGAVPMVMPFPLVQNTMVSPVFTDNQGSGSISGYITKNGLCWAASTTAGTLTLDATSSVWTTIRYN